MKNVNEKHYGFGFEGFEAESPVTSHGVNTHRNTE